MIEKGKKDKDIGEFLSDLPTDWLKLNEAERRELEEAIVMGKLARNTKFNLGGPI